jgi:hypothetical protein
MRPNPRFYVKATGADGAAGSVVGFWLVLPRAALSIIIRLSLFFISVSQHKYVMRGV